VDKSLLRHNHSNIICLFKVLIIYSTNILFRSDSDLFDSTDNWENWETRAKQLRTTWGLYEKSDLQHRMTRNRCTALCAALHSEADRGKDCNREQMSKRRGRWSARQVEIRDDIKHCETEERKRGEAVERDSGKITEWRERES